MELVSYLEWGSLVANQRHVEAHAIRGTSGAARIFEDRDQYSQEPPLTDIKNLEKNAIIIECYFV